MTKRLWIETDFFKDFHCKCSACRHSCCTDWKVGISKKDYDKLQTLTYSDELFNKLEVALAKPDFPSETAYRYFVPDYAGNCPMLDKQGLCMLQNEHGEDALADVCRIYPRSYKEINGIHELTCSNSCEAVIELLMNESKLSFVCRYENDDSKMIMHKDADVIS